MPELTVMLDPITGAVLVEHPERLPTVLRNTLEAYWGTGQALACAAPPRFLQLPAASPEELATYSCVRIAGYLHHSLIEGPGRRSTVKFQGCPLHCTACVTPDSWDSTGGYLVPVDRLAAALLDPAIERDGISVVGGEPFSQADGLLALIQALRTRGCPHIVVYSGYTYEALQRQARRQPSIGQVLAEVDVLIDGPYVAARADTGGPWTGSGNQRVIDLAATRRLGQVTLLKKLVPPLWIRG